MAKKSFKKDGGFGKSMYSSTRSTDPKKQKKISGKGFVRHTLMIKPEHLEELRDVAKLAKADMQEVLAAALTKYFAQNWPDDKKQKLRALREKEAQEVQDEKDNLLL